MLRGHLPPRHATMRDALPLLTPSKDDRRNLLLLICRCCCAAVRQVLAHALFQKPWTSGGGGETLGDTDHDGDICHPGAFNGRNFRYVCRTQSNGCLKFDPCRAFTTQSSPAWQVSTRHRPSTPRTSHQPHPSPKTTGRHRSSTCGHAACGCGWICIQTARCCSGCAAARPPSTDLSIDGGLLCFCPSGHSYGAHMGALKGAKKVCSRPYTSNSASLVPPPPAD